MNNILKKDKGLREGCLSQIEENEMEPRRTSGAHVENNTSEEAERAYFGYVKMEQNAEGKWEKWLYPVKSKEQFLAITDSSRNSVLSDIVMNSDNEEERKEAKLKLVQFAFQTAVTDKTLLKNVATPNNLIVVDVDFNISIKDKEALEKAKKEAFDKIRSADAEGKVKVHFLQESRHGVHVIAERNPLLSNEQNLRHFSEVTGVDFDPRAKDIRRVLFTVCSQYTKYADYEALFSLYKMPYVAEPSGVKAAKKTKQPAVSNQQPASQSAREHTSEDGHKLRYKSMLFPVDRVVERYMEQFHGGAPLQEGERNSFIFSMAADLSYFSSSASLLTGWTLPVSGGLSEEEVRKTCESALTHRPAIITKNMHVVMEVLMLDSVPPLPELNKLALSSGIRESLSVVPKELQVPVLFSIATIIGGIATQVRLQYHGYLTGINLNCYVIGPAASGKSFCTGATKPWLAEMQAEVDALCVREEEYRAKKRAAKNKKEQPEEIHDPRPILTANTSYSQLVQRLADLHGLHGIIVVSEAASFLSQMTAQEIQAFTTIIRDAYDENCFDRDLKTAEATSAHIKNVRLNTLITSTEDVMRQLFANVLDGTITRVMFATVHDDPYAMPTKLVPLLPEQEETIHRLSHLLRMFNGTLMLPKIESRINDWMKETTQGARELGDETQARAVKRLHINVMHVMAALTVCKCAQLMIDEMGYEEAQRALSLCPTAWVQYVDRAQSKAFVALTDTLADYLLNEYLRYFRRPIERAMNSAAMKDTLLVGRTKNPNDEFFEKLPNEFHIDDVLSVSDKNIDACKQMCSRWKRRGKVKALGYGRYQKL